MNYLKAMVGGTQPKLVTGTNAVGLSDCSVILPNADGCKIVTLKRHGDATTNWADSAHGNYTTVDLTDKIIPIVCDEGYTWSEITLSAGTCWAGKL